MEFVLSSKHSTGDISALHAPFGCSQRHDNDLNGNGKPAPEQVDGDHESDTPAGSHSPSSVGRKCRSEDSRKSVGTKCKCKDRRKGNVLSLIMPWFKTSFVL
jgi:hypothetical protein